MPLATAELNEYLNALLRGTAYTPPGELWLAAHTGDPGDTGANEKTGDGMQRVQLRAAAGGTMAVAGKTATSSVDVLFPANSGAAPYTITHVALWSSGPGAGGTFHGGMALAPNRTVPVGVALRLLTGDIDVSSI